MKKIKVIVIWLLLILIFIPVIIHAKKIKPNKTKIIAKPGEKEIKTKDFYKFHNFCKDNYSNINIIKVDYIYPVIKKENCVNYEEYKNDLNFLPIPKSGIFSQFDDNLLILLYSNREKAIKTKIIENLLVEYNIEKKEYKVITKFILKPYRIWSRLYCIKKKSNVLALYEMMENGEEYIELYDIKSRKRIKNFDKKQMKNEFDYETTIEPHVGGNSWKIRVKENILIYEDPLIYEKECNCYERDFENIIPLVIYKEKKNCKKFNVVNGEILENIGSINHRELHSISKDRKKILVDIFGGRGIEEFVVLEFEEPIY